MEVVLYGHPVIVVNSTDIKIAILKQHVFGFTVFCSLGEAKNSAHCGVQFSPVMQMEGAGTAALKPSRVRSALVT